MKEIEKAFYKKLEEFDVYNNETFDLHEHNLLIENIHHESISFNNCIFNCDNISFKNIQDEKTSIIFNNCTFNCNVNFKNCSLEKLLFNDTKSIKSLNINPKYDQNGIFDTFKFSNFPNSNKTELNTDFSINNITINKFFFFENVNHISGKLHFYNNIFGIEENEHGNTIFNNSTITNVFFKKNTFNNLTTFLDCTIKYNHDELKSSSEVYKNNRFFNNTFEKVKFDKSKFVGKCEFDKCDFLSTTWFEKCENLTNSKLKFVACEFKGFSLFNDSKINFLDIDRCTFLKSSSFTDAEFNKMKLYEVKFGGGAYFDEMKINYVNDKSYLKDKTKILEWKRSLRAIKQELQKTENKIDFNKFRAFELAAHYEELDWKWKSGFIDKSILFATKISTDFGNSWRKALRFTVIGGFVIYLFLYIIENRNVSIDMLNWNNWARLFSGFFRFLLVTDFYNPLETDRIYLTNPLSWLILIFGKIVIAFGIYEMIQSFRKFKA